MVANEIYPDGLLADDGKGVVRIGMQVGSSYDVQLFSSCFHLLYLLCPRMAVKEEERCT